MKTNAPKRKVFQDAVDLLTGGEPAAVSDNDIQLHILCAPEWNQK